MKTRRSMLSGWALAVMLASATGVSQAMGAGVPVSIGASLIDGYIAPATQRFEQAGHAMATRLQAYCATQHGRPEAVRGGSRQDVDDAAQEKVAQAFERLVTAWAGVEFLRFGPLVEDSRFERVFFWPDPRGVVTRQTQAVLATQDEAWLRPRALRAGSVAIQGLPSLEYALFGGNDALLVSRTAPSQPTPTSTYRCAYATAVAENVADLAGEIVQAWGPAGQMARDFRAPGSQNTLYRDASEVAAEAVKAMSSGVHFIRDAKLLPAMGSSPATARPARMPLRRSGDTQVAIEAGLRGIGGFSRAVGLVTFLAPEDAWLANVVERSAEHLAAQLATLDMPLEAALAAPAARERLSAIIVGMQGLKDMINGQVAQALGVNVGFNALDGD